MDDEDGSVLDNALRGLRAPAPLLRVGAAISDLRVWPF